MEVNGERRAKYKRLVNMKISGEAVERPTEEGFRGPVRKRQRLQPDEAYDSREISRPISITHTQKISASTTTLTGANIASA